MRPGPDSRYTVSPAVGEYALTEVIPSLETRIEDLAAQLAEAMRANDELRSRIAHMAETNGMEAW